MGNLYKRESQLAYRSPADDSKRKRVCRDFYPRGNGDCSRGRLPVLNLCAHPFSVQISEAILVMNLPLIP